MLDKIVTFIYNSIRFLGKQSYTNLLYSSASTKVNVSKNAVFKLGSGFRSRRNVELNVRENAGLSIGNNVFFNSNCIITCRKKIIIGDGVIFGPNVVVYDNDHEIIDGKVKDNQYKSEDIYIGSGSWIGAGSIILKGVHIGENAVVAAGCIVTKDIPNNHIFMQKRNTQLHSII